MRHCSNCGYTRAWQLADGRFKCRRCGQRYSWTSVWDAGRLSVVTKRKLVDYFVLGVPSYRVRFRDLASAPTIERFFRLIRAVLAFDQHCREPFRGPVKCDKPLYDGKYPIKDRRGKGGRVVILGICQQNGLIRLSAVQGQSNAKLIWLVLKHTRPGDLYYLDDRHAYAPLAIHGNQVVFGRVGGQASARVHLSAIESFWIYTQHWLNPYHGVPDRFAHLYLGEISFRFNHRDEDLLPLVLKLMKQTHTSEIEPLLGPK